MTPEPLIETSKLTGATIASPSETSETPVIVVDQLTARFGDNTIFDRVSFEVKRGEIQVILGGSGCGKSTLLRTIVGAHPAHGRQRGGGDVEGVHKSKQKC